MFDKVILDFITGEYDRRVNDLKQRHDELVVHFEDSVVGYEEALKMLRREYTPRPTDTKDDILNVHAVVFLNAKAYADVTNAFSNLLGRNWEEPMSILLPDNKFGEYKQRFRALGKEFYSVAEGIKGKYAPGVLEKKLEEMNKGEGK